MICKQHAEYPFLVVHKLVISEKLGDLVSKTVIKENSVHLSKGRAYIVWSTVHTTVEKLK